VLVAGRVFGLPGKNTMTTAVKAVTMLVLACASFDGSAVMAQSTQTDCHRNGNATVCETRDAQGRTSARTTCWPNGSGTRCTTQEYPNGDRPQR
jgi:hypothetical protein